MLNVVTLNLALLSRVASTGQPSRADLELAARSSDVMRRELKRLDTYIDGVLRAHARDDEGWQRLDLCACCQRIGLLIGARAARQRVTVRINMPETEVFIEACPAQLHYAAFLEVFSTERWAALKGAGAKPQRPLWASTGVKNKAYPDTLYVTELAAPNTVNTMPEATLKAFADHGELHGDAVSGTEDAAREVFAGLAHVGVDVDDVYQVLEDEGVKKFDDSWGELTHTVSEQLTRRSPEQA